jgi:threonine/homoserine/homoserine lactone efflux protein
MDIIILVIAILAVVFGLLLIVAPDILIKLDEFFNRVFITEDIVFTRRRLFGFILILAGIYLFYNLITVEMWFR